MGQPGQGRWEYRDYLIRAFNQDLSYRQFLSEQIAGDLLPQPRINRDLYLNESIIGPMFYHLGEHRHGSSLDFNGIHQDMVNNKIDAFSKAFLAVSVACARCHDHKLEAVSQRDYYSLAAVFMTPRWTSRVIDAPGKNDAPINRLKSLRDDIRRELATLWLAQINHEGAWGAAQLRPVVDPKDAPAVKLDDVAYPIARLLQLEGAIDKSWADLAGKWRATREERLKANAEFTVLTDLTPAHGSSEPRFPAGWVSEGDGIKHGFVEEATPLVALEGESVIARLLPRGIHTHALSSKLPGALRMPDQQTVPGHIVSLHIAGSQFAGILPVPGNCFQNDPVTFLDNVDPVWKSTADQTLKNGVPRVTVEFATAPLHPHFPPRVDLVKALPRSDLGYDKRSWLSIIGIVGHDKAGAPQDTLELFAPLYEADAKPPHSQDEAWRRIGDWLAGAVRRWCDGQSRPGDSRLLDWLLAKKLLPNHAAPGTPLANLLAEYRRIEQEVAFPRTVNSMDERELARTTYPINVRGNVDASGEWVPPDFLQMFVGRNDVAKSAGQRAAGTRPVLARSRAPAHHQGIRQPRLAMDFRQRHRRLVQ